MSKIEYKYQVVQFAIQARDFFNSSKEKRTFDDFDRKMYDDFWSEYNDLLEGNLLR